MFYDFSFIVLPVCYDLYRVLRQCIIYRSLKTVKVYDRNVTGYNSIKVLLKMLFRTLALVFLFLIRIRFPHGTPLTQIIPPCISITKKFRKKRGEKEGK